MGPPHYGDGVSPTECALFAPDPVVSPTDAAMGETTASRELQPLNLRFQLKPANLLLIYLKLVFEG